MVDQATAREVEELRKRLATLQRQLVSLLARVGAPPQAADPPGPPPPAPEQAPSSAADGPHDLPSYAERRALSDDELVAADLRVTDALRPWLRGFFSASGADWVAVSGPVDSPEVMGSGRFEDWPSDEQVARWADEMDGAGVYVLDRPPLVLLTAEGGTPQPWRGLSQRRPALSIRFANPSGGGAVAAQGVLDTGAVHTHLDYHLVRDRWQDLKPTRVGHWQRLSLGGNEVSSLKCELVLDVDYGLGPRLRRALHPVYLCQGLSSALGASEGGEHFGGLFGIDLLSGPNGTGIEVLLDGPGRLTRILAVRAPEDRS